MIKQQERMVYINVIDDGIGKSSDTNHSTSTGKGLNLIRQFFNLLNKYNSEKASVTLTFPEDERGNSLGAVAEIIIPLNYKYE